MKLMMCARTATAETSPVAISSLLPARHSKAIQSGSSLALKRACDLLHVAGEECMDFDAKHFQLTLPTAGYGAAQQSPDASGK